MFKFFKALSENKSLHDQIQRLKTEKQGLNDELVLLNKELVQTREMLGKAQIRHAEESQKHLEFDSRMAKAKAGYKALQGELQTIKAQNHESQKRIQDLEAQLEQMPAPSSSPATESPPDNSENLQALAEKDQSIQQLEADLAQAQQEQMKANVENKKLTHEVSTLQAKLSTAEKITATAADKKAPEDTQVLIVDDSITTRTLMKKILESAHYQVLVAKDGLEGKNAVEAHVPDIVVTDIEMPNMDGFELTRWIKSYGPSAKTPVIMITSLADDDFQARGTEAGASSFITKNNFHQQTFLNIIEQTLIK